MDAVLDCCSRAFDVVLDMGGGAGALIDSARSLEDVTAVAETLFERDDEAILVIVFLRDEEPGSDRSSSISSSVS